MHRDILLNELMKEYRKLAPDYQKAVSWTIKHYHVINCIVDNREIPINEFEKLIEYAKLHNEPLLLILLHFKNSKD